MNLSTQAQKKNRAGKFAGATTIALFVIILILDFMDQNMMSPLLNPLLLDFFNDISRTVPLGWVNSVFVILSAISMVFAGILADRTQRKWICFAGSMIYSTFSILTILIPSGRTGYVLFFITRAMNGIGVGAIIPTLFSLIGDIAKPDQRATVFSFLNVAMIIGQMGGLLVAGLVESATGNWRVPYFIVGLINFVLAFGLILIREPKRGLQEKELHSVILEGAEYQFRLTPEDFKKIWTNKSNFWLIINFIDCFPDSIILFFIFKYMEDFHNVQDDVMSIILLGAMLFGAIGTVIMGRIGDGWFKKDKRARVMMALLCNGVPVIFFIGFLLLNYQIPDGASIGMAFGTPGLLIGSILIFVVMFINQGVNPNWYSTLTDINLPENRATMISFASFMDMVGRSVGPLIGSYIADSLGLEAAMWAAIGFWVINVVLWLPIFYYIRSDLDNVHTILKDRAEKMKNQL